MKSILLSIRPEWVAKILNGEKTIEIRKKFPKDYVGWVYIYCTKGKRNNEDLSYCTDTNKWRLWYSSLVKRNSKVVARFWCDKVEDILWCYGYKTLTLYVPEFEKATCLNQNELENYIQGKKACAIHISKLEVFDRPRELSKFYKPLTRETCMCGCEKNCKICECRLTKAPQNYCYIESEE